MTEERLTDDQGKRLLALIDSLCPYFVRYRWQGQETECYFGSEAKMYAFVGRITKADLIGFGLRR